MIDHIVETTLNRSSHRHMFQGSLTVMLFPIPVMFSLYSKSQMIKAIKYVDILTVLPNLVVVIPFTVAFDSTGMFDKAMYSDGWTIVMLNVAFKSGSSMQG